MTPRSLEAEEAIVAARTAADRGAIEAIWKGARKERAVLALAFVFLGAMLLAGAGFEGDEQLLRGGLWLLVLAISGVVVGGAVRTRRQFQPMIDAAEERAVQRSKLVEHRWTLDRIVVVGDADGDGLSWWLFFTAEGGAWVIDEIDLIDDLPETWGRELRLVVDGLGQVVSVATDGAPISFADRAPREEGEEADVIRWSPPNDLGETPARVGAEALPPGLGG